MSGARKAAELLLPWAALIAGGAAWALSHQIGSDSVFDSCNGGTLIMVVIIGVVALVLTAVGAWLSYGVWRRGEAETEARRFIALMTAGIACLLALAIVVQSASALIIGSCFG